MRSFPERSPEDKRQEEQDDLALIQFLRQHRPPVPTAPPDLEDRIVAALDAPLISMPLSTPLTSTDRPERSRRLRWLLPATLAASLVAGVCSYQVLRTSPEPDPEVAKLEAFIDSTWSTPTDNPESEADFASQVLMEPTGATEP